MSLSPEADPSGFLERAPALASLPPDEALAQALAHGDAEALYAALTARLATEPPGGTRDTLAELVKDRALFVMGEAPPRLSSVLGTGVGLVGSPRADAPEAPFIATRAWRLLGVPVWLLGQHLARRGKEGGLEVLGRVPLAPGFHARRWGLLALLLAAGVGAPVGLAATLLTHEVHVVNGLAVPVRVCLDGHCRVLAAGEVVRDSFFSLPGEHTATASAPDEARAFETLSVATWDGAVYNVLGAGAVYASALDAEPAGKAPRWLGVVGWLGEGERLEVRPSGWALPFREHADAGRWLEAGKLAEAVALADASALQAREQAARAFLHLAPERAERFVETLVTRYPEDFAAHALLQDVFVATGHREQLRARYPDATDSVAKALLNVRAREPQEWLSGYGAVQQRFHAPEAARALARVRLAAGEAEGALELLDAAREKVPEAVEDLELRVRALVALKRVGDASNEVRRYGADVKHHTWDFAVLAGRLARAAGPDRTLYITRDFLPARALDTREAALRFELAAGDGTVKEKEPRALPPGPTRDGLLLARAVLTDLEQALQLARASPDSVVSQLEPDAVALLALELGLRGDTVGAQRLFGASLPALLAREPLEAYVRDGQLTSRFLLLPPGLRAAAHLVRARAKPAEDDMQYGLARETDPLQGFARRALDTWQDPHDERLPLTAHSGPYRRCGCLIQGHTRELIQIITGSGAQPPRRGAHLGGDWTIQVIKNVDAQPPRDAHPGEQAHTEPP